MPIRRPRSPFGPAQLASLTGVSCAVLSLILTGGLARASAQAVPAAPPTPSSTPTRTSSPTPAPPAVPVQDPVPTVAIAVAPGASMATFTAAADYSKAHGGRAVLITHNGRTLFERYDNSWAADRPHPLASGTKSFTGVVAMLAVQDGLLTLDELASDTITEWKTDPRKSKITVRHLLTLSSGLDPSDALLGGRGGGRVLGDGAAQRAERIQRQNPGVEGDRANWFAAAASDRVKAIAEPGAKFDYGPSHFFAFGELLQRKLKAKGGEHTTYDAYMRAKLLAPLGIDARFGRDRAGNPNLPGGCLLTARDWAKFGAFVLNNGSVAADGEPKGLLKPELLAECFKPSAANPRYGLTWWLPSDDASAGEADGRGRDDAAGSDSARDRLRQAMRDRLRDSQVGAVTGPDGKPMRLYMAAGLGKQRLYVLPDLQLVIVRFAEATAEGARFSDREFLTTLLGAKGK